MTFPQAGRGVGEEVTYFVNTEETLNCVSAGPGRRWPTDITAALVGGAGRRAAHRVEQLGQAAAQRGPGRRGPGRAAAAGPGLARRGGDKVLGGVERQRRGAFGDGQWLLRH